MATAYIVLSFPHNDIMAVFDRRYDAVKYQDDKLDLEGIDTTLDIREIRSRPVVKVPATPQQLDFARKAQEDARRCYKVYVQHRDWMEATPGDAMGVSDCALWQYRASIAAKHALDMMAVCRGDYLNR